MIEKHKSSRTAGGQNKIQRTLMLFYYSIILAKKKTHIMFGVGIWNLVFLSITYAKVKVRAAHPISSFAGSIQNLHKVISIQMGGAVQVRLLVSLW